jgi:tetratricopeptide (TPR) repeat protein
MAINTSLAVPALELAQMNDRSALLGKVFFENYGDLQSADARKAVAYEAAKFAQQNGDFALAGAMLSIVPDTAPNYAQIKNLEGIIMSLQGNAEGSIVPFLIAEQLAIQGKDPSLTNTVRINLARAYFAAGNFPRSIDYYRLVERNSNIWADAHFEQAWAYFRMNDMNSTLSMLQTHTSPFFDEFYYPEAELLRIYALFVMCKFPSAAKETDHFIGLNTPKRDVLDAFTQQSVESIFEQVRSDVEKGTTQIPFLVRSRFLNDVGLTNAVSAIQHAEKELVKLERMPQGSSIQTARTLIEADMEKLRSEVGSRVLNRAQFMAAQLQEMLNDADMHKLDILEMEAQMLRQASVTGKMEEAKRVIQRDKRLLNNERTWPYQGEYWADEIGYYRIKSKPECPNSMFR